MLLFIIFQQGVELAVKQARHFLPLKKAGAAILVEADP
jgi:hypothetical protein